MLTANSADDLASPLTGIGKRPFRSKSPKRPRDTCRRGPNPPAERLRPIISIGKNTFCRAATGGVRLETGDQVEQRLAGQKLTGPTLTNTRPFIPCASQQTHVKNPAT